MKRNNLLAGVLGVWAVLVGPLLAGAADADYAREKKWTNEVVPGLVVGDPIMPG